MVYDRPSPTHPGPTSPPICGASRPVTAPFSPSCPLPRSCLTPPARNRAQVSPWAAIIWRPDIYKYSAFNMVPTTKQSNGGAITLVPRTPRILTAMVEVRALRRRGGEAGGQGRARATRAAAAPAMCA